MKIRTQFILTLLLFGLILIGMVGSLILTNQQVNRLLQQEEIARRIGQGASELNYLSGDYLMYGESQQRLRWEASFASFSADVSKLDLVDSEQQTIVARIKADLDRLQAVFENVVSTREEASQSLSSASDPSFTQVSWSRMEVQNQSMAFQASLLSQKLRDEAERLKQMNIMLIFVLIGIFGVYLLTNYYLIDQRTLRSIAELQAGTETIGSGDLDYTIAVKRADEIGELSHAFNQMTANLKEVTASKADLEREIVIRERAEKQLERSNQKLNEILASIQDDFYVLDRDWNFVYASRLFTSKLGKEPEDFVGKNIWKMFPKHVGTVLEENFRTAMEKRDVRRFEIGGKYTGAWYRMTAFPSAEGITVIGTDITERRRAEEALRQSEARFRLALTHAPVSVATQDHDLVYTWAYNTQTRRTDEIVGKTDFDLFPAEAAYLTKLKHRVLETGENLSETLWVTSDDQRLFLDLFIEPLRNEIGEIEGVGLATVDLTQIKLAEEALQEVNERLEQQAVEVEMQATELREQKNELVDSNEHLRVSEELANQRFMEIQAANKELQSARLAALNLMEDALTVQEQIKQANLRLRESEQRLNLAQEIAHLGSWELDLVNNQLTWSDEVYRIFGLQPQEFGATYEAFLEAVHPDDRIAVDDAYSSSIRDGRDSYEIEHRIIRRSSAEIRVVYEKCEHFRDKAGRIVRSVGMVHDITASKLAEEALRASEELYRAVVDNALDAILVTDPSRGGRVLSANPAACRLFGYGLEQFTRLGREDIIDTSDPSFETLLEEREHYGHASAQLTYKRKDGKKFSGELSSVFYQDKNGERRAVAIIRDVTQRLQAEAELRHARDELELRVQERTEELGIANRELLNEISERQEIERQLRIQTTAMESAANGIIITDCQGNIEWTNPALSQISGYAAHELIGQSTRVFNSGRHDSDFYRQMWETILAGNVWQGETTNRRKDGSLYVEEQTITPVRDANSQISHFIAIKQDVTERNLIYAQLEESNRQLTSLSMLEHQQRKVAETLSQASVALSETLDLQHVMETILDYIQLVLPADAALLILSEGDNQYRIRGVRASEEQNPVMTLLNQTIDLLNEPVLKPFFKKNTSTLIRDSQELEIWAPPPELAAMRNWLGIPLISTGRMMGIVVAANLQADCFSKDQIGLAEAVVSQATVAMQNAWLFEQVRSGRQRLQLLSRHLVEIQENERKYIARELHDETSQALTSLKMGLHAIEQSANGEPTIVQQVAELRILADEILESLHRLAMNLRPASLDHLGLVEALTSLVRSTGERSGIVARFKSLGLDQRSRLTEDMESSIYRIVQESLTNIIRHARATYADVILEWQDDQITIIVEDDGIGINPVVARTHGQLGLVGMQERAEMLGGKMLIDSTPDAGTTLVVEIPYAH